MQMQMQMQMQTQTRYKDCLEPVPSLLADMSARIPPRRRQSFVLFLRAVPMTQTLVVWPPSLEDSHSPAMSQPYGRDYWPVRFSRAASSTTTFMMLTLRCHSQRSNNLIKAPITALRPVNIIHALSSVHSRIITSSNEFVVDAWTTDCSSRSGQAAR